MVQRKDDVRACVVVDVTGRTLKRAILENVDRRSRLMTDQLYTYRRIGKEFPHGHHTVHHHLNEYVRGDVYTNTVECYFALLKGGLYGTFHALSKKHLHRYVSDFQFRWNTRKVDDGEHVVAAIKGSERKRLMYREPAQKCA